MTKSLDKEPELLELCTRCPFICLMWMVGTCHSIKHCQSDVPCAQVQSFRFHLPKGRRSLSSWAGGTERLPRSGSICSDVSLVDLCALPESILPSPGIDPLVQTGLTSFSSSSGSSQELWLKPSQPISVFYLPPTIALLPPPPPLLPSLLLPLIFFLPPPPSSSLLPPPSSSSPLPPSLPPLSLLSLSPLPPPPLQ